MKLHYKGKYNFNPDSLPSKQHKEGAVPFKEYANSAQLGKAMSIVAMILMVPLALLLYFRCGNSVFSKCYIGMILTVFALFPHELLHAICFKEEVYLYTNLKQGMLFVVGNEDMSKFRFIFMSLLPNLIFGAIPYVLGVIYPQYVVAGVVGAICLTWGVGDYYNV